jgi:hypothetical protein
MNTYLIERDKFDFLSSAYNAHLIAANNEEEVRKVAKKAYSMNATDWDQAKIVLLGIYTGENKTPFIILSDYNAGLTDIF